MLAGTLIFLAGLLPTLMSSLLGIIAGVLTITIGFFIVHAIASGWVGRLAARDKKHASSLYLLAGASLLGSARDWLWRASGWTAVAVYCMALVGILLVLVLGPRGASKAEIRT